MIKHIFSYYNIFFSTQQAFAFHFRRDFSRRSQPYCFLFFFFFRKVLISFISFFVVFLYFLDNIQLINVWTFLYMKENYKNIKKKSMETGFIR